MKRIPLTKGFEAIVDDEDYELVSQYSWYCWSNAKCNAMYARGFVGPKQMPMHRLIMGDPKGHQIDHINRDGLDNRRSNLRLATTFENHRNIGLRKDNKTGYKGVFWLEKSGRWLASIRINGRTKYLGLYNDIIEAAKVYNAAAIELFGEFAWLNKV